MFFLTVDERDRDFTSTESTLPVFGPVDDTTNYVPEATVCPG